MVLTRVGYTRYTNTPILEPDRYSSIPVLSLAAADCRMDVDPMDARRYNLQSQQIDKNNLKYGILGILSIAIATCLS